MKASRHEYEVKESPLLKKKYNIWQLDTKFCCLIYRVPLKIMGVKPLSSNDQMISDAKLFPTRSPRYPVCFPKASAAGPVSLNGHSLHWLSRRWLTGLSGVFGIFFCGKCFTTSFLMSYEPQKRHPGGPWSFITRVNEASLSFWDQY